MPVRCWACGADADRPRATCAACGGFLRYVEDDPAALAAAVAGEPWAALPDYDPVRMGEGDTPLVPLDRRGGDAAVHGKLESLNPTCSFKDRGSALLVSAVADPGTTWEAVVVASTGNTAPSVAAYAARAGLPCAVVVPAGTPPSKLSQVAAHGADVYAVEGSFSDCFRLAREASDDRVLNATAVYSANPFVASANRTVAFELAAELGGAPDWVSVPVGAGPLLGGTYQGFVELAAAGLVDAAPRMLCVQARGCHPVVAAWEAERPVEAWTEPITTDVGAIADPLVGYAADGERTRQAVVESGGVAVALPDDRIHACGGRLADREGVYAEPASAAAVAGVEAAPVASGDTVVALVTGHGLKEAGEAVPDVATVADAATLRAALLG
jgi:threonine synthase